MTKKYNLWGGNPIDVLSDGDYTTSVTRDVWQDSQGVWHVEKIAQILVIKDYEVIGLRNPDGSMQGFYSVKR